MNHCWTHQRLAKSLAILSPSWRRRCKDELQSYPFQLRRRWQSDSASHWICGLLHPCWSTPLWSFMCGRIYGHFWSLTHVWRFSQLRMLWLMTQYCLEEHQNISERQQEVFPEWATGGTGWRRDGRSHQRFVDRCLPAAQAVGPGMVFWIIQDGTCGGQN